MKNKTYDILKYITQIIIPASGTLYFTLATTWNLPYGQEVLGTLTAVDTFLGVCLGLSSAKYNNENN